MKKKILLFVALLSLLACFLVISVGADSVHSGNVDLNATVTLDNGTVCNLFDSEGNALIWYNDADGNLQSIRADDSKVKYKATYKFNVGNSTVGSVTVYEVSDMWIALESGNIDKGNIVVLNLMDDDVLVNEASNSSYLNNPVNCLKAIQWANKVLEYAYLRLDTYAIQKDAFCGCPKLKYINLENLTELRAIGGGTSFSQTAGDSVLFAGEVLDLTKTKLCTIGGDGTFNNVPFIEIKLPNTVTNISSWAMQGTAITRFVFPYGVTSIAGSQFNDCKSLTEIYINNTTTAISDRAFNNTALEKIFFVGTEAELNALLDNTGANNNTPFWDVVGTDRANIISYAEYEALADKSGKYAVYGVNYCDTYENGNHTIGTAISACVSNCSICQKVFVSHVDGNVTTTIVYASFLSNGEKVTACQNAQCTHKITESTEALFICQGYSGPLKGNGGVLIGFAVNKNAISAYTDATGKTVSYGLFAGLETKLGTNEAVSTEGVAQNGAVSVDFTTRNYDIMEIKVVGFTTDEHKSAQLALGAYVIETNGDEKTVSYLQSGEVAEGKKYVSKSYNDLVPSNS